MKLEACIDDPLCGLRRVQLRHGCLASDARRAHVLRPGGPIDEKSRRIDIDRHIGDMSLDELQIGERGAEELTVRGMSAGERERVTGKSECCRPDGRAEDIKRRHGDLEALSLPSNERIRRHAARGEGEPRQRMRRDNLYALGDREAG